MSNNNKDNNNSFRENEPQNAPFFNHLAPVDSPHVDFATRAPSIIPTPIYDDDSTIMSSPPPPSVVSSNNFSSPSPLSIQIRNEMSPATPIPQTAGSNHLFDAKTQLDEANRRNNNYGPTFRDDDGTENHYNSTLSSTNGAFITRGFVPRKSEEDEIQLHENINQHTPVSFDPSPDQSRVDIFMNKLKGYQNPTSMGPVEEGTENGHGYGDASTRAFPRGNMGNDLVRQPIRQRGLLYRQLFGSAKYAVFTWVSAIIMVSVFVYELIRSSQLSGSAIQTNPFNPMIGPNYMALVNMGSKFDPCMRDISSFSPTTVVGNCYASVSSTCTIEEACGFGGFKGQMPNQSFRFFIPMFMHAGIIHILFNLISHFQVGSQIEYELGLIRYMVLYFAAGIFGSILSGVLAGVTVATTGCSGALFGLIGYQVSNLFIHWKNTERPGRQLTMLLISALISLALGLLPGIDNFAHIGGFIVGLLLGGSLSPMSQYPTRRVVIFIWIVRIVTFILVIVVFVVFLHIFYTASDLSTICPGCRYLSCLPVSNWCST